MKQLICPVSNEMVNERLTRLNALFTVLLISAGFVFDSVFFSLFMLIDFFIRAFSNSNYSPVSRVSLVLTKLFQMEKKPIDKSPKIFAARMGFIMTLAIAILYSFGFYTTSMVVAGVLVFFATLEFVFGICVGCYIYTYLVLPAYR